MKKSLTVLLFVAISLLALAADAGATGYGYSYSYYPAGYYGRTFYPAGHYAAVGGYWYRQGYGYEAGYQAAAYAAPCVHPVAVPYTPVIAVPAYPAATVYPVAVDQNSQLRELLLKALQGVTSSPTYSPPVQGDTKGEVEALRREISLLREALKGKQP